MFQNDGFCNVFNALHIHFISENSSILVIAIAVVVVVVVVDIFSLLVVFLFRFIQFFVSFASFECAIALALLCDLYSFA